MGRVNTIVGANATSLHYLFLLGGGGEKQTCIVQKRTKKVASEVEHSSRIREMNTSITHLKDVTITSRESTFSINSFEMKAQQLYCSRTCATSNGLLEQY
uniref:Uncharacterized protein n=1 Tax=Opuntia streptacantha TaxID=393608 RepID=A0A7C8ZSS7_OPUST